MHAIDVECIADLWNIYFINIYVYRLKWLPVCIRLIYIYALCGEDGVGRGGPVDLLVVDSLARLVVIAKP